MVRRRGRRRRSETAELGTCCQMMTVLRGFCMRCVALTLLRYPDTPAGYVSTDTILDISLESVIVEVSSTEETTIYQLICTELIGVNITLRVNSILTDVCFRSIITTEKECIIFDGLHQFPECNQSVITIESIIIIRCILTNALVKLLLNLLCLLIIHKVNILCHYFSKHNGFGDVIK